MNPIFMALLLIVGWGVFAYSAQRRWKLMMVGASARCFDQPARRLGLVWTFAFGQLRMPRYPLAGLAHVLIFWGFLVLVLRTLILWGRGFDASFDFFIFGQDQMLGRIYALTKDIFAVLVLLGALVFVYYRMIKRPSRMTLSIEGLIIIWIIVVMMLADIAYDGASMVRATRESAVAAGVADADAGEGIQELAFHVWEPAGSAAQYLFAGLTDESVRCVQHVGFWTHTALVLIFLNLLPYSKHFHVITAIPNVYFQDLRSGRLPPIEDIDGRLEREQTLGIKRIDQFSWKSILDLYTCTECGRCSDQCPATNTGKKLSPKPFTLDLRDFLYKQEKALVGVKAGGGNGSGDSGSSPPASGAECESCEHHKDLVDGVIDPEVLWACTTCRACEQECPVFITYVDKIVDMRRYLVQERGELPTELQTVFRSLEASFNPWGFPAEDRAKWAEGLEVKTLAEHPDAELVFWVGCAPAFDARAKKVTQATAKLMLMAGVDFAILGDQEQCTGDPARRAGNEYLFQMFARQNIELLNKYGAEKKKIVTTCPHCFHTLANEYGDFGGHYEVVHHTTLLAQLVRDGKLQPVKNLDRNVCYHDSCYLGRYNDLYDAPREVLKAIPGVTLREPKATRDRGLCCGAGGAQMFKEEESGDKRVNAARTEQLLETDPDTISSACPFCMRMLTDGLADAHREDLPQLDIAEILLESVEVGKNGDA